MTWLGLVGMARFVARLVGTRRVVTRPGKARHGSRPGWACPGRTLHGEMWQDKVRGNRKEMGTWKLES